MIKYLLPEDIAYVYLLNKKFNRLLNTKLDYVWEYKRKTHFPNYAYNYSEQLYKQFQYSYLNEYPLFNPKLRTLFSIVKEEDITQLQHIELTDLSRLLIVDRSNNTLLSYAHLKKNQEILNHFYYFAKKTFAAIHTDIIDIRNVDTQKTITNRTILYWAIKCNQPRDHIQLLINKGSRPDEIYNNGYRPLHIAATLGKIEIVEYLLKLAPEELNQSDEYNQTALLFACANDHYQTIKFLLNQTNIDFTFSIKNKDEKFHGWTALHWVIARGDLKTINLFLDKIKNNQLDLSPTIFKLLIKTYLFAAYKKQLKIVKSFLQYFPTLLNQSGCHNQTALILACLNGHYAMVKFLTQQPGIHLTIAKNHKSKTQSGWTALHAAANKDYANITALLLTQFKMTDLQLASNNHEILIDAYLAAAKAGKLNALKSFINHNSEFLNQIDELDQTALIWAAANGHISILRFLLQQPDINLTAFTNKPGSKKNNWTALHWAAYRLHTTSTALLLKKFKAANINLPGNVFPLLIKTYLEAVENNQLSIVKTFIQCHPNILNSSDEYNQTALLWAAAKNHTKIVKFLLSQPEINLNAYTHKKHSKHEGWTALHWAADKGHDKIVNLILNHYFANIYINLPTKKNNLTPETQAKLKLIEFISKKKSLSFFNLEEEKVIAIKLKELVFINDYNSNYQMLLNSFKQQYEHKITNTPLGKIYKKLSPTLEKKAAINRKKLENFRKK